MQIPKEHLEEFKKIWKEEFGEEIDDIKALEQSNKLCTLIKTIADYIGKKYDEGLG